MNDHSKVSKSSYIVNGDNHANDTREKLEEYAKKAYDAECGSGFYCIEDEDIAKKYALLVTQQHGGKPTLNYYKLNYDLIKSDLKIAYFNSVEDPRTLEYLGGNLEGQFPSFCKKDGIERASKHPVDLCYTCSHNCPWSGDYIEAVLSDATYNLNDIFTDYWNKKITFQKAVEKIYERVDEAGGKLHIQIVLRGKILDIENFRYLEYVESKEVEND